MSEQEQIIPDRDWISFGLYTLIWALWIVMLVREPIKAAPLVLVLILLANPYIDKRYLGAEVRTMNALNGRHLHAAFKTKDGKVLLRSPNRNERRVTLAVMAALLCTRISGIMDRWNPLEHPGFVIAGILALAAFFVAAFVFASIRGMRST